MTLTITATTLCICRHVFGRHDSEHEDCCTECRCVRFQAGSSKSSCHYRRGEVTRSVRVARLEPGDLILVWHSEDLTLRPAARKTGALVGRVTGRRILPAGSGHPYRACQQHVIETDLGVLPPLTGASAVLVVLRGRW